jgi:hypothetical protein
MASDYSSDQYMVDYESRYPMFSDYQVTDDMIAEHRWDRPARSRGVHTYEAKYQTEQMQIPAYMGCNCGKCTQCEWPRRAGMRKCSVEQMEMAMALADEARMANCRGGGMGATAMQPAASVQTAPPAAQPTPAVAAPTQGAESMIGGMTTDQSMLLFVFIMFVVLCYCIKSIIELKAELKNLRGPSAAN